ncbi:MAG: GIY-YIG nuclease family protein [Rhizomicrobium sp.]
MVAKDTFNVFIAVYMMASRRHGTIYTGVTSKLPTRIHEHREGLIDGFTKKYSVHRLVWYEPFESMVAAIRREKSIKKYPREWKINLIERENPFWDDLYPNLVGMNRKLPDWVFMGRRDEPGDDEKG